MWTNFLLLHWNWSLLSIVYLYHPGSSLRQFSASASEKQSSTSSPCLFFRHILVKLFLVILHLQYFSFCTRFFLVLSRSFTCALLSTIFLCFVVPHPFIVDLYSIWFDFECWLRQIAIVVVVGSKRGEGDHTAADEITEQSRQSRIFPPKPSRTHLSATTAWIFYFCVIVSQSKLFSVNGFGQILWNTYFL